MGLVQQFTAYSTWRMELSQNIQALREWLQAAYLGDAETDHRLASLMDRLESDKLTIAFVAEFSRGKSELINALFFGDCGQRVLPSSTGRTTMCPTELAYDPEIPPQIALLPIETRDQGRTLRDCKASLKEWTVEALNTESAESLRKTLMRVGERKKVALAVAERLGFGIETSSVDAQVEIPAWRHAMINFPHPLLKQGLVILDTPGLNAIGTEPELTLSLLPSAHAILFMLAVDTGVTHSDLEVWRKYVLNGKQRNCLVVLNKIDSLWDGLRSDEEIGAEIRHQVQACATQLALPEGNIFPVSAQKALLAKIQNDPALLARSRIEVLEQALTNDVIPAQRKIIVESIYAETAELAERMRKLLESRLEDLSEQLNELRELRGKSQNIVRYIMLKVKAEKDEFEQSFQQYYAVRSVLSTLTNKLFAHLGMEALREDALRTREAMLAAAFSRGLKTATEQFFSVIRGRLNHTAGQVSEISDMLTTMYKRFDVEHGLPIAVPEPFSLTPYIVEIDRLESHFEEHFNLLTLITREKRSLTQQFFETVAAQVRRTFEGLNRDIEYWLRGVMTPLETRVKEHRSHLKRRLASIKQVSETTDNLEDRIADLTHSSNELSAQLESLLSIQDKLQESQVIPPITQ